jgi:Bifunctional DNA primase/polymerase, N-terminal/AAA domain
VSDIPTDNLTSPPVVSQPLDPAGAYDSLNAALAYEARGFSVIPLVPSEKRPAVTLAPFLSGQDRMSAAEIRTYWTANPQHGVGIVTGTPSGLVVVDVDPRNGGSVEAVLEKGCATDLVASTGGGGVHFFLRHPGPAYSVPCGKTVLPGVDRKGDGGYVVAPPTVHPNGTPYTWEQTGEVGELPPWVLERPTATAPTGEDRGQWVADAIAHPEAAISGTQEDTLTRLTWYYAGQVQQGRVDYDIALSTLCLWTSQLPLGNKHDPWTEQHVRDRLDRGIARRKDGFAVTVVGTAGSLSVATGEKKRAMTDEEMIASVVAACRSAKVRSLERLPQVEWIAPLVLPRGVLVDLHGDPKAGKSTFLAHLLRAILEGGEFFGQQTTKTKAIWFTEQPPPTFAPLLQAAGLYDHPDLLVLHHYEAMTASWHHRVAALVRVAVDEGAGVLVIDTFTKLAGIRGEDENNSGSVLTALDALEMAKAAGLTVILVRHDRKSGGRVTDAGRGSNAVAGEVDVIYQLVKDNRDDPTARRLGYVGRLGEIPGYRLLSLTEEGYGLVGTPGERNAQQRDDAQRADWELIASVLPRAREEAISVTELAKRLEGRLGISKVRDRLAEYRQAVEEPDEDGYDRDPGLLTWLGKDGRGGWRRACGCGLEFQPCGECEGCTGGEACRASTTLRLVTDPECSEGNHHAGASTS